MDTIKIPILQFVLHFKPLLWREEFGIKFQPNEDRLRTFLAAALVEVSGVKVNTLEEAKKVLAPLPSSVIQRVFVIYKGSLPNSRMFTTIGLYKAPEAKKLAIKFEEVAQQEERVMDKVEKEMEQKFGKKELEEARRVEREMIKNSKLRGATKSTPDKEKS